MVKKIIILTIGLLLISTCYAACPSNLSDKSAINIAEKAMNTWFTAAENGNITKIKSLFAPQFVILHSQGAPMTKAEELKLLTGFHLGGYHFSDFCAMRLNAIIIATFASKTYGEDISKSKMNFLSKSKAYRMVVLNKKNGQWQIVAYANTNPITH